MNKKALEQKDNVKYLGVLIDQHLRWNYHISNISKKISRGVGILSKLRKFMDTDLLKTIYYCLVYSHVSYGIHAWGSACKTECEKINVLLKTSKNFLEPARECNELAINAKNSGEWLKDNTQKI